MGVNFFQQGNGVPMPAQPPFLDRRDIGIEGDLAGTGVLAVTDDHDAMPGSELSQAPTIEAFDGDMQHAHAAGRVAPIAAGANRYLGKGVGPRGPATSRPRACNAPCTSAASANVGS